MGPLSRSPYLPRVRPLVVKMIPALCSLSLWSISEGFDCGRESLLNVCLWNKQMHEDCHTSGCHTWPSGCTLQLSNSKLNQEYAVYKPPSVKEDADRKRNWGPNQRHGRPQAFLLAEPDHTQTDIHQPSPSSRVSCIATKSQRDTRNHR